MAFEINEYVKAGIGAGITFLIISALVPTIAGATVDNSVANSAAINAMIGIAPVILYAVPIIGLIGMIAWKSRR